MPVVGPKRFVLVAPMVLVGTLALASTGACGSDIIVQGDGGSGQGGDVSSTSSTFGVTSQSSSSASSTSTGVEPVGGGGPNLVEEPIAQDVTEGSFPVTVDAQTLGVTAVAVAQSDNASMRFSRLTAPSTALVYDNILPSNTSSYEWTGTLAAATPQISHAEVFPLAQGTWTFDFESSSSSDVSLWRRKTQDGQFHGGVLDVNIFVPDALFDEAYILDMLNVAYYDFGGVELGDVRFFPIDDSYMVVDDQNLFPLLDETNAAETRPALNIMLTASIEGSLEGAAGFAMGIPGAPIAHGSEQAAIVWMLYFDGFFDGIILKHEAGHFAGLWHTSEFSPGLVDPLDDTPPCEDVNSQFEGCPDYDYIMFPTGGSGEGFLSPRQSAVIHGSAIYRGSYAAGEAPMPPYGPPLPQGKKASVSDLDAARARASTLRTQRSMADQIGSWANTVPVGVAHHLAGIGCPEGADASAMGGYFAQLNELGATNASVMLDIATDESAPAHVRRRAIGMAARLVEGGAPLPGMNAAFEALALDADGARLVRSAALRGLARVSASDARRVAGALEHELDPVIARAVKSVR